MRKSVISNENLPEITDKDYKNPAEYFVRLNDVQFAYWIVLAIRAKRPAPLTISSSDRIGAEMVGYFMDSDIQIKALREKLRILLPQILQKFLSEWRITEHPYYIDDLLVLIDAIGIQGTYRDDLKSFYKNKLLPTINFFLKNRIDFKEIKDSKEFQHRMLLDLCSRCLEVLINSGCNDNHLKWLLRDAGQFAYFTPLCFKALVDLDPVEAGKLFPILYDYNRKNVESLDLMLRSALFGRGRLPVVITCFLSSLFKYVDFDTSRDDLQWFIIWYSRKCSSEQFPLLLSTLKKYGFFPGGDKEMSDVIVFQPELYEQGSVIKHKSRNVDKPEIRVDLDPKFLERAVHQEIEISG